MRFSFLLAAAGCVAAAIPTGAPAAAAPTNVQAPAVDSAAIIAEVRRTIANLYVLPERRGALDAVLAEGVSSGRYRVTEPELLAERVTEDLRRVGRDRHLYMNFNPDEAARLAQSTDPGGDPQMDRRKARLRNHGIAELRVLPGNIRYMRYDGDQGIWIERETPAALENAMRFLAEGDAIIIDIRGHNGGDPRPAQYILSHFLRAGTPLYTSFERGKATKVSTLPTLAIPRMIGKPLYVLAGKSSASAAEELAGHVAGFGIGQLVGETTAGAGFMNEVLPIDGRFVLSVSTARVELASTGKDWEAVGIAPTLPVPETQALEAAHIHALRALAAKAPAREQASLRALAEGLDAQLKARAAALPLRAYAGQFGDRAIIAEDQRLYYQRGTRPRVLLIPLGSNRFAFANNPAQHLSFEASGGSVEEMVIVAPDGSLQGTYQRTS